MRKKDTVLMSTSVLIVILLLGTTIASAAVMKASSKKAIAVIKYPNESTNTGIVKSTESMAVSSEKTISIVKSQSESANSGVIKNTESVTSSSEKSTTLIESAGKSVSVKGIKGTESESIEIVSEEGCSLYASLESKNLECDGGCKDCEQVVKDAWNYAKQKADEATNIPDDFNGVPLIERIRIIRHEIRKYFIVFAVNFAIGLNKESKKLPFDPDQAVAGAVVTGITEFVTLMLQYPLQPGLNLISALQKTLEYVKAFCNGKNPENISEKIVGSPSSTIASAVHTGVTIIISSEQTVAVNSSITSKTYISKILSASK